MKKNKKLISTIFIILLVIVVFTLIIVTKLHKSIVGTWISDGGTIYEFQKSNRGFMRTSIAEYKFTYKITGNIVSIDFEDSDLIDTDYEYQIENNKCIMKSNRGTFNFTKQ